MRLADFENFEPPDRPKVSEAQIGAIARFVHDHPFEYTLDEIADEFGVHRRDAREALRLTGERLTAIPVQDGVRHVYGYADEADKEWDYLRRRAGAVVSQILSLNTRMSRVYEEFGLAKQQWQDDVAVLLLDLLLALPDDPHEEADNG